MKGDKQPLILKKRSSKEGISCIKFIEGICFPIINHHTFYGQLFVSLLLSFLITLYGKKPWTSSVLMGILWTNVFVGASIWLTWVLFYTNLGHVHYLFGAICAFSLVKLIFEMIALCYVIAVKEGATIIFFSTLSIISWISIIIYHWWEIKEFLPKIQQEPYEQYGATLSKISSKKRKSKRSTKCTKFCQGLAYCCDKSVEVLYFLIQLILVSIVLGFIHEKKIGQELPIVYCLWICFGLNWISIITFIAWSCIVESSDVDLSKNITCFIFVFVLLVFADFILFIVLLDKLKSVAELLVGDVDIFDFLRAKFVLVVPAGFALIYRPVRSAMQKREQNRKAQSEANTMFASILI